jgi:hypothetical protein
MKIMTKPRTKCSALAAFMLAMECHIFDVSAILLRSYMRSRRDGSDQPLRCTTTSCAGFQGGCKVGADCMSGRCYEGKCAMGETCAKEGDVCRLY